LLITVLEFTLLAISSLFVIVDPIAVIPAFLAMTPGGTPEQRRRIAVLASGVMAGVLLGFALVGKWIFLLFGITMPALQVAASIVLLLIALDMLRAQRSRVKETREETDAGTAKDDIAITPLAIPMLSGPGAISTTFLLRNQATDWMQVVALCVSILIVSALTWLILRLSAQGARWLNPIAMRITTRLMGLLLAAVAMQFLLNALKELKLIQ
jgi:multiple antibiotic resistance protein